MELLNSHNLALLPDDARAAIELHKSATFADFKGYRLTIGQEAIITANRFKRGAIDRSKVKRIIEASHDREKLRDLINKYIVRK